MAKLGIDLGTSNSASAVLVREDLSKVLIVRPSEGLSDGASVFPSYVAFDSHGNVSAVGLRAKERYRDGATEFVVRHFKRLIGRPYDYVAREIAKGTRFFDEFKDRIERGPDGKVLIKVAERNISVIEITSYLLRKIIEDAESIAWKQWRESITGATISLPAEFDDEQRGDTVKAVKDSGLENVKVIEEPTAAAIARGIEGETGNIMVVDVGAGTTDIVVGHIGRTEEEGLRLIMSSRMCDGELGGLDMDYLILEYLLENDMMDPRLRDVYPILDQAEKGRLMALIETAKINAALSGTGLIATILRVGDRSKHINMPLNEDILSKIVSPIVYGYKKDRLLKGIRPLIEKTLLEVAGFDPTIISDTMARERRFEKVISLMDRSLLEASGYDPVEVYTRVRQVKKEIQHLILVGGPCRMKCVHKMLEEVFGENEMVCKQIRGLDPLDPFFMEGVAKGAALSLGIGIETGTQVPYNISIFHLRKGRTLIIPKGTPYRREEGITKSAPVPAHAGPNTIHILSEKEGMARYEWPMKAHLAPGLQDGDLLVTLYWCEAGTESTKATIEGCGLPGKIAFPPTRDTTTLGKCLQDALRYYLEGARNLRQRIKDAREPLRRQAFKDILKNRPELFQLLRLYQLLYQLPQEVSESVLDQFVVQGISLRQAMQAIQEVIQVIEKSIDENLRVPEAEIRKCETIEVEAMSSLTEEEIESALKEGYFAVHKRLVDRCGIPRRAREVLDLTFSLREAVPVEDLIQCSEELLEMARHHPTCSGFAKQLDHWLGKLRSAPTNPALGCMVAGCLGALADCLHNCQPPAIDEETFYKAKYTAYAFSPENS